tara:strand:+ start:370 stop:525 length:156 start_codon:yes stop_codon:yes gene_type:complete
MSIIGISIGYVVGFNVHKFFIVNYLSYLPVFIMGVGCAIMIYVALFLNERK